MVRRQTCPICGKELAPEIRLEDPRFPFCTERCRLVDLRRWFAGEYAVVEPLDPDTLPERLAADDERTEADESGA